MDIYTRLRGTSLLDVVPWRGLDHRPVGAGSDLRTLPMLEVAECQLGKFVAAKSAGEEYSKQPSAKDPAFSAAFTA